MTGDPVMFDESGAHRIVRVVRAVEGGNVGPLPAGTTPRYGNMPPNIRAVLLEPLIAGGTAQAELTRYDNSRFWFDVVLLGYPTNAESTFTLTLTTHTGDLTSEDIRIDTSAADLKTALIPWGMAERVVVGFGTRNDQVFGRWSIGIEGPFDKDAENLNPLATLAASGSIAGSAGIVAMPTTWAPTGEIIEVHEGGLIVQDSPSASLHTTNTPLRPGAAIHAAYHHGAGYVVHAAEARKFSTIYLFTDDDEYY